MRNILATLTMAALIPTVASAQEIKHHPKAQPPAAAAAPPGPSAPQVQPNRAKDLAYSQLLSEANERVASLTQQAYDQASKIEAMEQQLKATESSASAKK